MNELSQLKCTECKGGTPRLTESEISGLQPQVPGWRIITEDDIPRLEKIFSFSNFAKAMAFSVAVGELAEQEGHHPAILTEWGKVTVRWWTHKIRGLHRNDFIMAAKTDQLYS